MRALNMEIFTIPSVVLILVVLAYGYFLRKVTDKSKYKRCVAKIICIALVFNLLWEVSHGFLYEDFQYDLKHISFCALATVADVLMVLLIFFGFAILYKNIYWIWELNSRRLILLIVVGTTGAILAEIWFTGGGYWAYAANMPLLPFVKVGVSPVIQFALLPWLIFSTVVKKMKKY
ncbi:MAG: hypothetical protein AB3N10_16200 [Allomuricauda sp.]|uniref:hypothetical protein n=1 Tax=Flagellimonas flava TaxID=570519 RepID=UPI0034B2EE06